MNLVEFTVFITLFGLVGIFIAKMINLMEVGKRYEPKYIFVGLALNFLLFGINFTTVMTTDFSISIDYNPLVYFIYLRFSYLLMLLNLFLTIGELIAAFNVFGSRQPLKRLG